MDVFLTMPRKEADMRTVGRVVVVLVLGTLLLSTGAASDRANEAISRAIPNLLTALESDNAGLRESAAYYLGEYRCEEAVIPLMGLLRNDERESTRIVAALALCRIGDARGTFAVKRAVLFDESARVRTLCAWYYTQYHQPGAYAFVETGETGPTLAAEQDK
jgi:HEAT repeat protein